MSPIKKWRELAASINPAERQLALDLAPSIAAEIQEELLLWHLANPSPQIKNHIWVLLNPDTQAKFNSLYPAPPASIAEMPYASLFSRTDDEALQKIIAMLAVERLSSDTNFSILYQIIAYKELKKCGLLEARVAIEQDLYEIMQNAKNEGVI